MATVQSPKVIYPTSTDRSAPLVRTHRQNRTALGNGVAVAAVVAPAVAVTFFLGRRLLRRRPPATKAVRPTAQLETAVPTTDNLDLLGLDPAAPLPPVTQPPPPPLPLALFDADVPCSVAQLFRVVMGPDAAFIRTQHGQHGYWDVSISEWAKCADGRIARRICFTTPLTGSMGPKQANCEEEYALVARSADGFLVSMEARTPNVPFGDAFYQHIQFLGTAASADSGACRLRVSAEVTFTKRVIGLGGMIRSSATKGMQDTYSTYMASIQAALDAGNGGGGSTGPLASQSAATAAAEAAANGGTASGSGAAPAAISSPVHGPLPETPPGKVTPQTQQQPPQWAAGSPAAAQLWSRWFRDLGALCALLLSLWLLRRALHDAAVAAAAAGSSRGPGFWQGHRVAFRPGPSWPLPEALPAAASR